MKRYTTVSLFLGFALCLISTVASAMPAGPETRKLVRQVRDAFVFFSQGSGAVITSDGLVLTNSHVLLDDSEEFSVRLGDGRPFIADLLGKDPFGDLALLKLRDAKGLAFLPMADPESVFPGQVCLAVGNPFALGLVDQQPTFTLGVVSALHQLNGRYTDSIVTDVPINPGNSGGPLINFKGELIGINGMIRPSLGLRSNTGLAFAIPANQIKLWIPKLRDSGNKPVHHGMVRGVTFENDDKSGKREAKIKEISKSAEELGFKVGDIVLSVNDEQVWSPQRFFGILGVYPEKSEMTVKLMRDGKEKALEFQLPTYRPGNLYFSIRRPSSRGSYLIISKVEKGSPAEKAGLKVGDRLAQFQGYSMKGMLSYQLLLMNELKLTIPPGSRILMEVIRKRDTSTETKRITYIAD